jgi:hypothetical protein
MNASYLKLKNDGNLVLVNTTGAVIWSSTNGGFFNL